MSYVTVKFVAKGSRVVKSVSFKDMEAAMASAQAKVKDYERVWVEFTNEKGVKEVVTVKEPKKVVKFVDKQGRCVTRDSREEAVVYYNAKMSLRNKFNLARVEDGWGVEWELDVVYRVTSVSGETYFTNIEGARQQFSRLRKFVVSVESSKGEVLYKAGQAKKEEKKEEPEAYEFTFFFSDGKTCLRVLDKEGFVKFKKDAKEGGFEIVGVLKEGELHWAKKEEPTEAPAQQEAPKEPEVLEPEVEQQVAEIITEEAGGDNIVAAVEEYIARSFTEEDATLAKAFRKIAEGLLVVASEGTVSNSAAEKLVSSFLKQAREEGKLPANRVAAYLRK